MRLAELFALVLLLFLLAGCARRASSSAPREAQLGRCAAGIERELACGRWAEAVEGCEGDATSHTTFPALSPDGCYVPVHYENGLPRAGPIPEGCGYPRPETDATLAREALRYRRMEHEPEARAPELSCALPAEVLRAAARHNAATLEATRRQIRRSPKLWPYAAVATFGFGHPVMSDSALVPWRPGDRCLRLDKVEMDRLGVNRIRAGRAAAAHYGGIAPTVTVSGGAIHADLIEAFMLLHLLACEFGVPQHAILLDPCADHTHTNVRNTGSMVIATGGRTAYIVTDSGLQGAYLQDWTSFDLIGGSVDQRALRDWGYLIGSWHQASVGMNAGFWFTPYRFWGAPDALSELSCVR